MNLLAFHYSARYMRAFAGDLAAGASLPIFGVARAQSVVPVVGAHARGDAP
jgi:hypothetical protein